MTAADLHALTAESARHDGARPFCASIVRFGPREGQFSLMSRRDGGWARFCVTYNSASALAQEWRLRFLAFGEDEHGPFIAVEPLPVADVAR